MVAHFADEFSYRVEWEVEANSILDGLGNRNIPSLAGCPCVLAKMMDHEPVSDHPFELHSTVGSVGKRPGRDLTTADRAGAAT